MATSTDSPLYPRTGIGYDVHRFIRGRALMLGGVQIPYPMGLDGHSDADVLLHAICDAILGAMGERDIGHHFPNNDPAFRNIPSIELLKHVVAHLHRAGGRLLNLDSTLISEAPKIGPYIDAMRDQIAPAVGLPRKRIGIKATSNEGLGFIGRSEGVAAFAVASLLLPEDPAE
jgi:2-C-methyl-D-erythritol 2,4-cyclodiphosphate synthase